MRPGPGLAARSAPGAPAGRRGRDPRDGEVPLCARRGEGTPIHPPCPLPFLGEDGDSDRLGFSLEGHTLRAPQDLTCGGLVVIPPVHILWVRCSGVLPPGTAAHPRTPHQLWGSFAMLTPQ